MADDDGKRKFDELVRLKAAFWVADRRCSWLADQPGEDDALNAARAQRSEIVVEMYSHSWWASAGPRYPADQKVIAAARPLTTKTLDWAFPSAEFAAASGTVALRDLDPERDLAQGPLTAGIVVEGTFTAVGDGTLVALEGDPFAEATVLADAKPEQEIAFTVEGMCTLAADHDASTASIEVLKITAAKPALAEDGAAIIRWIVNTALGTPGAGLWEAVTPAI
ncbi:hypothetical protein GCM10009839_14070 [Catenulispora yoronensis]|uniref:Uncharacterized protein n=1 Tax=Catenulispora yoronensis TaxID=450799 RepID=A0ABP5F756_9ACTN